MPEWEPHVRKLLEPLKLAAAHESEVVEELVQHLADTYKSLQAGGASHEQAMQDALRELEGNHVLLQELRLGARNAAPAIPIGQPRGMLMRDFWQDLRYGFRMVRTTPLFTAVVVLTLALGIGANGTIFSVVNAVLIRNLPFPQPDNLVMIWEARPREGVYDNTVSPADFSDWRVRQRSFDSIATYQFTTLDLTGFGEPRRLSSLNVSSSFLKVFRVSPMLGRDFTREEEQAGRNQVAILSHSLWQAQFARDPAIVGKKIVLSGEPFEVIGVLPPGVEFPHDNPEILFPIDFTTEGMRARFAHSLRVYGRLKPGVTIAGAQDDMNRISAELQSEVELQNQMHGAAVISLREQLVGGIRKSLFVLLAAVGFVLLIACVNVANLLLSRGTARRRELAIRSALGAARFRIARQFSVECLWFALLGALAAVPIAYWGVQFLKTIIPFNIPRLNDANVDLTVVFFMLAAAAVTAFVFGLAPVLQVVKVDLADTLKQSNPHAGRSRAWLRGGLLVSQIALAFILLIGAGLMLRSLFKLQNVDPGFDKESLLTMPISLSSTQITPQRPAAAFFQELMRNIRALPGVTSVSVTWLLPMTSQDARSGLGIEGREANPDEPTRAHARVVTPDYFTTMKIGLSEGRLPSEQEMQSGALVVVINRTAASKYWPGQSPLGKRVRFQGSDWREIIGVVSDVRHWGLSEPVNPEVYIAGLRSFGTLMVRAAHDPENLAALIRNEVRKLEPTLPTSSVRPMTEIVDQSVASPRFYLILLGIFAGVALILASAGVYGVMSFNVNQSTRDIAVRMAMGAKPHQVLRFYVGRGMVLTVLSLAIGSATAYGLTRLMQTLLFGIAPTDPLTFTGTAGVVAVTAFLACYLPARRASKVDPMVALKHQ
jgi:putative ABC transport system permease protein